MLGQRGSELSTILDQHLACRRKTFEVFIVFGHSMPSFISFNLVPRVDPCNERSPHQAAGAAAQAADLIFCGCSITKQNTTLKRDSRDAVRVGAK
jgi:hypothetical protein